MHSRLKTTDGGLDETAAAANKRRIFDWQKNSTIVDNQSNPFPRPAASLVSNSKITLRAKRKKTKNFISEA